MRGGTSSEGGARPAATVAPGAKLRASSVANGALDGAGIDGGVALVTSNVVDGGPEE